MGVWNKLFGGAEGAREAMRESYAKHVRLAREARIPAPDSPHVVGLFGALATRYQARLQPKSEVELWPELAPFLAMPEALAVEMLAEYVIYQETPSKARFNDLRISISNVIEAGLNEDRTYMAAIGLINGVGWSAFLTPSAEANLRTVARNFLSDCDSQ